MKKIFIVLIVGSLVYPMGIFAQPLPVKINPNGPQYLESNTVDVYVSKQTREFTKFQGAATFTKTTDRYEHGTIDVSVQGPIAYEVQPNNFNIGPNESKKWTGGKVYPILEKCPEPGNSASAFIKGNYDVTFSRPQGMGTGGTIVSTYSCPGCLAHTGDATHEIVNKKGVEQIDFIIYSIQIKIKDIDCNPGNIVLHADVFPSGGEIKWTTPFGPAEGNDVQVPANQDLANFKVSATYTIGGVSFSDSKSVQRNKLTSFALPCCSDKKVNVSDIAILKFDGTCKPNVVFTPATIDIPQLLPHETVDVLATADGVNLTASITMVNKERKVNDKAQVPAIKAGLEKTVEGWRKAIFENVLVNALNGGVAPCQGRGNKVPRITLGAEMGNLCCPGDSTGCVKVGTKYYGELKWAYEINCHFPVFGVPYVASLDAVVSAGVSASLNLNAQTTCTGTKFCAGADLKAFMGGGVGATVLAGAVSADLQLIVDGIGISGEVCIIPLPVNGCAKITLGKLKVVGNVKLAWGLTSNSVEYTIYEGSTYGPWCF